MRKVGLDAPREPLLLYETDTPRATIDPEPAPPAAAVLALPTTLPFESRTPTSVPRES